MDMLQMALDRVEAIQALRADDPDTPRQREEASRLSCELFAVRMMAVRLSSTLAHLRQVPAASRDDRIDDAIPTLRSNAPGA
jgi:hypothetical protein